MLFDNTVFLFSSSHTSPAFNLAAEEYFLMSKSDNFILLWRNEPSIIIGKNQNAYAELDLDYVKLHDIKVIRRLTGGGAVFHDLGNLNFTFIKNGQQGMADFKEFLSPVTAYLRSLGLSAEFSGRNDILIDGMKVSGTAQTNHHGRVMLHGTLLFDASLSVLSAALKPNPLKLQAKGIKSVKSRVTNISTHLGKAMSISDFIEGLSNFLSDSESCKGYDLISADEEAINLLASEKYSAFSWNFGNAPPYSIEKSAMLPGGIVTANFEVKSGEIRSLRLFGDFFGTEAITELEKRLQKIPYEPSAVAGALSGIDLSCYIMGASSKDIIELLF